MGKKIPAIDDEAPILEALETILSDMGHTVTTFSNSIEGEKAALSGDFDLILCDMRTPEFLLLPLSPVIRWRSSPSMRVRRGW